ncbi:hypothetical protein K449DRAFT_390053 [Hypoxylon sp. EC38]|nr:hypothetical protein K449DRAFT_390053 [Hypoxylon sp. EC38]
MSGSEMTFHTVTSSTHGFKGNDEHLSRHTHGHPHLIQGEGASPAEKWKALTLASKASTESLAKDAKERRLRRSPGHSSHRHSEESSTKRNTKPEKSKLGRLSPERKSIFENSPQPSHSNRMFSPAKPRTLSSNRINFDGGRSIPRRSSSKPVPGSVKAMTALFDDARKDSRASSPVVFPGWASHGSKGPSNFVSPYSRSNSPLKSMASNASLVASTPPGIFGDSRDGFHPAETLTHHRQSNASIAHSNFSLASSRVAPEDTRTKFPHVALRPIGNTFSASRKAPSTSPTKQVPQLDRELSQPPSLGTMVPHLEEPPVAQHITFVRPSPSASPLGHDGSDDERATMESPRPGTGNSVLHYQIRHLQKHLEQKTEENIQLRRQLEARENMDIGKLMEQLRSAKRECKMWRERAEAAEKRVKVFKQFTARVRGLRDSVALAESTREMLAEGQVDGSTHSEGGRVKKDGEGLSFSSEHTENQDVLKDRIRQNMKERAAASNHKGVHFDGSGLWESGSGPVQKKGLWEKNVRDSRTEQLWDIAEELLMLDGDAECECES